MSNTNTKYVEVDLEYKIYFTFIKLLYIMSKDNFFFKKKSIPFKNNSNFMYL